MNHFRALPSSGRPWILAHRGASAFSPENTLEAALRGHQAGADGWELDVRLTRDHVPVVIHDASLLRTTDVAFKFADDPRKNDGYRVADLDWHEIQTLDAGSWFVNPAGGPRSAAAFGRLDAISPADHRLFGSGRIRIPTLEQALTLTCELDWLVNVELKTFPEGNAAALIAKAVQIIQTLGCSDRVLISSFQHSDLHGLADALPHAALGVLTTTPLYRPQDYVRNSVGADFYHPSAEVLGANSDAYRRDPTAANLDVSAYVLSELPTLVYTVNDAHLAVNLGKIGVAGIFTDDPGKLRNLWDATS